MVQDGFAAGEGGDAGGDDDGWLRTGGLAASQVARMKDVRTVDDSGEVGEKDEEEEIPDMEDDEDDDEAIIRDPKGDGGVPYVEILFFFSFGPLLEYQIFPFVPRDMTFTYLTYYNAEEMKQPAVTSERTPST